ncbi:hypothetical protein FACS18945_3860 [Bacteroidia bacterium]|nr:hypothetical protein FACS18945_3860 [Bacteroidia bacterium]
MKRINYYLWIALAGAMVFFSSCEKDEDRKEVKISFEDVALNENGYQNSFPDGLILSDVDFYNYSDEWSWSGFAVSNNTDSVTAGYGNQYSVFGASGANGSQKFAVAYDGWYEGASYETTYCQLPAGQAHQFKGLWVNNATVTALDMRNGSGFSKKFAAGDWFKIVITGFAENGTKTADAEFYLADFRNGKNFICNQWTFVDLSKLGKVNKLGFAFDSSDTGDYGVNTPKYACIDDIVYYTE